MTPAPAPQTKIGELLTGSWRSSPPPLEITLEDLRAWKEVILVGGVAGLVWRRISSTPLSGTDVGTTLANRARRSFLRNVRMREELKILLEALRSAGIEAILIKGFVHHPHYGSMSLRPMCDLDLCVRERDREEAVRLVERQRHPGLVDLHIGVANLAGMSFDFCPEEELFSRARDRMLEGVQVRTFCDEDHFRIACIHMLRHQVAKPIWLCDVAATVESLPRGFDWDLCLRNRPDWVRAAVLLAHRFLGADLAACPFSSRDPRLPSWILEDPSVVWRKAALPPLTLRSFLRNPVVHLRKKWFSPLETISIEDIEFDTVPIHRRVFSLFFHRFMNVLLRDR